MLTLILTLTLMLELPGPNIHLGDTCWRHCKLQLVNWYSSIYALYRAIIYECVLDFTWALTLFLSSTGLNTTVRWVMFRVWPCCVVCSEVMPVLRNISLYTDISNHDRRSSRLTTPAMYVCNPNLSMHEFCTNCDFWEEVTQCLSVKIRMSCVFLSKMCEIFNLICLYTKEVIFSVMYV